MTSDESAGRTLQSVWNRVVEVIFIGITVLFWSKAPPNPEPIFAITLGLASLGSLYVVVRWNDILRKDPTEVR